MPFGSTMRLNTKHLGLNRPVVYLPDHYLCYDAASTNLYFFATKFCVEIE